MRSGKIACDIHRVITGVVQFTFWLVSYFVLLNVFATSDSLGLIDHIYTSIFVITLLLPVSANDILLIPRLLKKERYVAWFISVVLITIAGTWFNQFFFAHLVDYIFPGYYFISYYEFSDLAKFFTAFVSMSTLLTLSLEWFKTREDRHKLVTLGKAKTDAELKALTSQINPHFLFNSLTVLYNLALNDSKMTSDAIIKLSDILRYVIYESSSETVSLRSEVQILRDYIELQRYRVHASTVIEFEESVLSEDVRVAPMMFLPLLENSFKHGVHGETKDTFVKMSLYERKGVVTFTLANNKPSGESTSAGIGIKNLKDRLDMLYPGKHEFIIDNKRDAFIVRLEINTAK